MSRSRSHDGSTSLTAFSVLATLVAPDAAACDRGDFRVAVDAVMGPSGATLLGRFCHGDAELSARVVEHLRAEEALRPDAIYAEIVHLPEERIGNLLQRPRLREYEIPLLGTSGAPVEQQLPLRDLMVSVVGDRIVLRSRRLGKEIIPRLSTAHHYADAKNLRVYQFLCGLQSQEIGSLGFGWGPLESAPYLPRLVSGRWIIARARWRLDAADVRSVVHDDAAARFCAVQALRARRRLPRVVTLAADDQQLCFDLDNCVMVDSFVDMLERKGKAILLEALSSPAELCARGPDGGFAHELLVPFVAAGPRKPRALPPVHAVEARERSLPIGSECLYAKLYTGPATADALLVDVVGPLVRELQAEGAIARWTFIRYADPDWHLRLRCFGEPATLLQTVLPRLTAALQPALAARLLSRFCLDTYEREIERYGGLDGTRLAERLFGADSEAVLALVSSLDPADADARWRAALVGIDRLLDDLGFDLAAKHLLARESRRRLGQRLRVGPTLERALGQRYRSERLTLEAQLAGDALPEPVATILATRAQTTRAVAGELQRLGRDGALSSSRLELAASYAHMFCNRLLRAAGQEQELVLYDFLERLYESQLARRKQAARQVA